MELTKQERKLVDRSLKKYRKFFCQKSGYIGWFGVVLFLLGILPIFSWADWIDDLVKTAGVTMVILSVFGFAMTVIGKLYQRVKELEDQLRYNNPKG